MYPEYELVQTCLQEIERKLNWGPSNTWHNDVFVELSEHIQQHTQVLLSPTTLKRVWGKVDYKSTPSITTLNTLAQYTGYQNWRDFKNKSSTKKPSRFYQKITSNLGVIMLGASLMTIVFISFYSLKSSDSRNETLDLSKISFSSRPVTSGLPNSVVFNVDLDGISSDSIYIQQYWDPNKTIKLSKGQKQATGQYYLPGYFRAKLLVDGKIIKRHDLYIKSDGWLGTVDYEPIPKYVQTKEITAGPLAFSAEILEEIKSNEKPISSTFHLVDDFESISGDNFVLNTTLKNSYNEKWAVCQHVAIFVLGTKSSLIIPFSIPGCTSEIGVMMSDVYLNGKKHDLSGLGVDMSVHRNFRIAVKDKKLSVSLEGTELFRGSYTESIGEIAGLRYRFLGAGEISSIILTDSLEQHVVIEDHFY